MTDVQGWTKVDRYTTARETRKLAALKAQVDADPSNSIKAAEEEPVNARLQQLLLEEQARNEKLRMRKEARRKAAPQGEEDFEAEEQVTKTKKQLAKEKKAAERERQKQEAAELWEWENGTEEELKKKRNKNSKKLGPEMEE